jgi:hypothetical protein
MILGAVMACRKPGARSSPPDTIRPVIVLNGRLRDTVSLNAAYTDPGARALDSRDGDLSTTIVVSGKVDKDKAGHYYLYYNVKDAAGNAAEQRSRLVYVRNDAEDLEGIYRAETECLNGQPWPENIMVMASGTRNNELSFRLTGTSASFTPAIRIEDSSIDIPMTRTGEGEYVVGQGIIAPDRMSFTVTYTSVVNVPFAGNRVECMGTYYKYW